MQTEIVISGFGGQGVLFAGQLLAHAALDNNFHVTWFPSYGPEMRGGTAHCTVIVSEEDIGSPVIRHPRAAIVMNLPSFDKYEPLLMSGGVLAINASLVDRPPKREDVDAIMVPADEVAEEIGDRRLANLVMVGALVDRLRVLSRKEISDSLRAHIPAHRRDMLQGNLEALRRGGEYALAS